MTESQELAVRKVVEEREGDPGAIALILCGSLAAGYSRPGSDVDFYLVKDDSAFEAARAANACFVGCWDPAEHFGVETDGKVVGLSFLREAALRGSEPVRASFEGARVLFSRDPEIEPLLPAIASYPEAERASKIKRHYGRLRHYRYVGEDAISSGDAFHAAHCAIELGFHASRLALAHNRVLYPCRKGIFRALARCAELPTGFIAATRALASGPDASRLTSYYDAAAEFFKEYAFPDGERVQAILEEEWAWYSGARPMEEE